MDPKACLDRLIHSIKTGDHSEAVAALNDYYRWRLGGGFEPRVTVGLIAIHGDLVADREANRLADLLEQP